MGSFEYKVDVKLEDGTTKKVALLLKPYELVPSGVFRLNRHNFADEMWESLEWGLTDEQLAIFDTIPHPNIPEIVDAWRKSAEVDSGESDASSASSTSTVRRSKRTASETDSD